MADSGNNSISLYPRGTQKTEFIILLWLQGALEALDHWCENTRTKGYTRILEIEDVPEYQNKRVNQNTQRVYQNSRILEKEDVSEYQNQSVYQNSRILEKEDVSEYLNQSVYQNTRILEKEDVPENCLSFVLSTCISICLNATFSIRLFFIEISFCLSACHFICLSFYLSVFITIYL